LIVKVSHILGKENIANINGNVKWLKIIFWHEKIDLTAYFVTNHWQFIYEYFNNLWSGRMENRDNLNAKINWQFTATDARVKLKRLISGYLPDGLNI
jgi:hypothetical protein